MRFVSAICLAACGGGAGDDPCAPRRAYANANADAELRTAVAADTSYLLEPPAVYGDGSLALATCSDVWFGRADGSTRRIARPLPANAVPTAIAPDASGGGYVAYSVIVPGDPPQYGPPELAAFDADGKLRWTVDGIATDQMFGGDAGPYVRTNGALEQLSSADGSVIATWPGGGEYAPTGDGKMYSLTLQGSGSAVLELRSAPGAVVWTKTLTPDTGTLYGIAIAAGANGVVLVGQADGGTSLSFGDLTFPLPQSQGVDIGAYVASIDASGATRWAHGLHAENLQGLEVAAVGDLAVVAAEASDAGSIAATEPADVTGVFASYDASGLVHAIAFAGASPAAIAASPDGSAWVTLVGSQDLITADVRVANTATSIYANVLP